MSQKLCLPINDMMMTASYKNDKYRAQFGYSHYGADAISLSGKKDIVALGDGTVIACGQDGATLTGSNSRLGICIVIVYKDVQLNDGRVSDLACRMFHYDNILCKVGDTVKAGSLIGKYGNTGAASTGPHLHIEFDTDAKNPRHAVGIKASGKVILIGSIDSTVDPSKVWFRASGQTIKGYGSGWTSDRDVNMPVITGTTAPASTGGITPGCKVMITGDKYFIGGNIPAWVKAKPHVVSKISGDKALLDSDGGINSWVYLSDLRLV